MTILFAILSTAHDVGPNTIIINGDLEPVTSPGGVLEPLPSEARKTLEEIVIFSLLQAPDYDVAYGYVTFTRTEKIFWLDYGSMGWFSYSWCTADMHNVSSSEPMSNKRMVNRARHVVEEYAEVIVFPMPG